MIYLKGFLSENHAGALEKVVREGPYKSVIKPFQPEPVPLPAESLGPSVSLAASETFETAVRNHRRSIQPERLAAISELAFVRFLDGMSLGYTPVPALHDIGPVNTSGMRCDALIHVRLSAPDQYKGGDMQIATSDRSGQRFALGQGDAVLLNWEDIFALRVVHQGPLLHMVVHLQYHARADTLEALAPLAEAARSKDKTIAGACTELLTRANAR